MNPKTSEQAPEGGGGAGGAEGSLGEQLRRARTERGINLREVSEQTRITMRHLEAIEADDYKALPGGIFNKSFVKSFARQVGFPEARALELYERTARERGFQDEEPATSPQRSRVYMGDTGRSPLMTYGLSLLIVGLLALVVYAGLNYYRRSQGEQAGAPDAPPTPDAARQQAAAQPSPTPAAAEGFRIQVKAARSFWLTSWQDDEKKKRGRFLKPDAPEEFEPASALNLHYDLVSADALQVSVNGRPLRTPADATTWTITKDNYRQFAQ
ncbi:MAG: helix-turn-helix domain-containing protein [Acidobacteria bacterium]|nr:helix-turn-helix domain-containing protein [Acidobacteriota bacterium]